MRYGAVQKNQVHPVVVVIGPLLGGCRKEYIRNNAFFRCTHDLNDMLMLLGSFVSG